jgi:hypothetical protein
MPTIRDYSHAGSRIDLRRHAVRLDQCRGERLVTLRDDLLKRLCREMGRVSSG